MARNNNKIRKSQLINTFAIGSVITTDLNESLLILANKRWRIENNLETKQLNDEENLKNLLGVNKFISPPNDNGSWTYQYGNRIWKPSNTFVRTIRFPRWHYCTNIKCRAMHKVDCDQYIPQCRNKQQKNCKDRIGTQSSLIPVRFLLVCTNGHVDDYHFTEHVHDGINEDLHQLEYNTYGNDSSTSGIMIKCITCNKQKNMGEALLPDRLGNINYTCKGYRHWLFEDNLESTVEECNQNYPEYKIQGIQKGASNFYYAINRSAIWIPKDGSGFSNDTIEQYKILKERRFFENTETIHIQALKYIIDPAMYDTTPELIMQYHEYERTRAAVTINDMEDIKFNEYTTFNKVPGIPGDKDYEVKIQSLDDYESWVETYFDKISLLEKMRETKAFCGFRRILPYPKNFDNNDSEKINSINGDMNEIPAIIVRGEGIFLNFNLDTLDKWRKDSSLNGYKINQNPQDNLDYESETTFVLLHSFAHLLIKELSLECGYNSSSIKERIYANTEGRSHMAGILIYTSDGDSEGSLGGLVRLGKPGNFERIMRNIIQKTSWCSGDPVCSSIGHQGPQKANLAACHNCLIISETSCSHFNKYLDRSTITKTYNSNYENYFKEVL
ncbi:hypothetical protein CL659_06080 [bacterium]|nr:hypothetical protein [bacterium]